MLILILLLLVLSELFLSHSISVKAVSFPGPDSDLSTPPLLHREDRTSPTPAAEKKNIIRNDDEPCFYLDAANFFLFKTFLYYFLSPKVTSVLYSHCKDVNHIVAKKVKCGDLLHSASVPHLILYYNRILLSGQIVPVTRAGDLLTMMLRPGQLLPHFQPLSLVLLRDFMGYRIVRERLIQMQEPRTSEMVYQFPGEGWDREVGRDLLSPNSLGKVLPCFFQHLELSVILSFLDV